MRPQASLIMAGTLFGTGMAGLVGSSGNTLDWQEMGLIGGMTGALLTLYPYARWLAGPGGARLPLFWQGIAFILLFFFWFMATLSVNTAWSPAQPIERIEGSVTGKRVSKGRYSDSYSVQIATRRGDVDVSMPKDVWDGVAVGRHLQALVCPGLLGYPYVATPLDRAPYLDLKRLFGLRQPQTAQAC